MRSKQSFRAISHWLDPIEKVSMETIYYRLKNIWNTIYPKMTRASYETTRRCHEDDYYGLFGPLDKMASVGSRGVRSLSLGQRVFSAFREWYIYACGYRQIGVLFLHIL